MLLSRDDLIATLFRETDRAQRMKTPLTVVCCGIDDWPVHQSQPGDAALASAWNEIEARITRLLRCYDSAGWIAEGELAVLLPGCNRGNAEAMAKRLDHEVFALALTIGGMPVRFNASLGVVSSGGRSPLVVLRDAEHAVEVVRSQRARSDAVECSSVDPSRYLAPQSWSRK
jgi:two-component system, cell cycle response regulator